MLTLGATIPASRASKLEGFWGVSAPAACGCTQGRANRRNDVIPMKTIDGSDRLCMPSSTLTLTHDDALSVLEYWRDSAERLTLVYRTAADRLTRIGRGRIRKATAREARIDTDYGCLRITMDSAFFEFGMLASTTAACFRGSRADGLLIRVELDDWIFLRSAPALQPSRPRQPMFDTYRPRLSSVAAIQGDRNGL